MNQKQREDVSPQVVVIEDDVGVRESLVGLLKSMKFNVTAFSSATEISIRSPSNGKR